MLVFNLVPTNRVMLAQRWANILYHWHYEQNYVVPMLVFNVVPIFELMFDQRWANMHVLVCWDITIFSIARDCTAWRRKSRDLTSTSTRTIQQKNRVVVYILLNRVTDALICLAILMTVTIPGLYLLSITFRCCRWLIYIYLLH